MNPRKDNVFDNCAIRLPAQSDQLQLIAFTEFIIADIITRELRRKSNTDNATFITVILPNYSISNTNMQ